MRRFSLAAAIGFAVSAPLVAQTPPPARFEVASVKINLEQDPGGPRPLTELLRSLPGIRVLAGGRVESYRYPLRNLIAWAYGVNLTYQKIEGKRDVLDMAFDISAQSAAPSPTTAEAKAMLRTLLEERFQLRWRLQPRDADGYQLAPSRDDGRPGPGLRAFTDDCAARANNPTVPLASPDYAKRARCGWTGINGEHIAVGVSMADIAERLTSEMLAPVADRTGWSERFSFDVIGDTSGMPRSQQIRPSSDLGARLSPDGPELLEAFRRELGLKLTKERVTIDDFIVERVEPLIEN